MVQINKISITRLYLLLVPITTNRTTSPFSHILVGHTPWKPYLTLRLLERISFNIKGSISPPQLATAKHRFTSHYHNPMTSGFCKPYMPYLRTFYTPFISRRAQGICFMSSATGGSAPASSRKSLGVIITGSTKGVGRALAEQFLKSNDSVIISSRTETTVAETTSSLKRKYPMSRIYGCVADVREHSDVAKLASFAKENFGTVDAFICNAGTVGPRGPVADLEPEQIHSVVTTNLIGSLYCAKEAQRIAKEQQTPLHVFFVDGSGTRGNSTAGYAAYGASKRSLPQLVSSLSIEAKDTNVRFHTMSPGMVLTDLLLGENQEPKSRRIFNILAEEPETVATEIVPQLRAAITADKSKTYIMFLTIPKAIYRLLTGFLLGFRKNLFFDETTGKRIESGGQFSESGVRINKP